MKKLLLFMSFVLFLTTTIYAQNCQAGFNYSINGLTVQFTDSSFSTLGISNYFWSFGDGNIDTTQNPSHSYQQGGSYQVCLNISDSICSDSICYNITLVNTPPPCNVNFTYSSNSSNNSVIFYGTIAGGTAPYTYLWDFGTGMGNGATTINPTYQYSSPGVYGVTLTATDANGITCSHYDSIYVNNCSAFFSSTVQSGGAVSFNNFSVPSPGPGIFYSWNFGDGSPSVGATNPVHIYTTSGTYWVSLNLMDTTTNCSSSFTDSISVQVPNQNNCSAGFSYTVNNDTLTVTNQASNYTSLSYDFGDGTTSTSGLGNLSHIYTLSGRYVVCQTVVDTSNSCTNTFCDTINITVPINCNAKFSANINDFMVDITNQATNYDNIYYDFGDGTGSSLANPSHQYLLNGSYIICQTVSTLSGCTSVFCDTVIINVTPPCIADFTAQTFNDTTYFSNLSSSYDQVSFDFGDGFSSTNTNPIHEYTASGTYIVTLTVYNSTTNCVDSIRKNVTVTISSSCVAKYELALDTNQRDVLFLINTSSSDNTHQYLWDFGDGNTSNLRLPNHQYALNQAYNICLTVFDSTQNCISTYCDSVGLDSNGNILKSAGFKLKVLNGTFIGLEESHFENSLSVYPNPFKNNITVELTESLHSVFYSLFNMQGKLIEEGSLNLGKNTIETENINTGVYFLRLNNANQTTVKQIIKM